MTNCVKRGGEGVEEHWEEADDMYHLKIREFRQPWSTKKIVLISNSRQAQFIE